MTKTNSKQVQVMLPIAVEHSFDYLVPDGMSVKEGDFVTVPLGSKISKGVVWGASNRKIDPKKMKSIKLKSDIPPMSKSLRAFIEWVAEYSVSAVGNVLAMSLSVPAALNEEKPEVGYRLINQKKLKPTKARMKIVNCMKDGLIRTLTDISIEAESSKAVIRGMIKGGFLEEVELPKKNPLLPVIEKNKLKLSGAQKKATEMLQKKVKKGGYSTTLLDGVTGSGKTEVYFEAIREALLEEEQALILLPEIVLTTQLMERFKKRFGFTPVQWHSALTPKQRRENWRAIALGHAPLIIGARSALFLPYKKLGIIVVDEEHENAFKQEDGVIYHARDMAVTRASIEKIPAILVSASPSLETVYNVQHNKFSLLHLPQRHGKAIMPHIEAVDMRQEKLAANHWISSRLKDEMIKNAERGLLSMLYLNRRGYAPLTLCRKCGYRFQCHDCSSWLVEHRNHLHLQCHHCGFSMQKPKQCPACAAEDSFAACGPGVERLEEEVREFLPAARLAVMTSDTVRSMNLAENYVRSIEAGQVDVIIGTQMVAKGHHFRRLTLVGVIDADMGLEGGDLRAAERSFQLLQQVAGRAGREDLTGTAIVQSYNPENDVMQALIKGERDEFIKREMRRRERVGMPPFSRMAAIIISGKDETSVKKLARKIVSYAPHAEGIKVLGPAPAPLLMLRGKYRFRILVITKRTINIQKMLKHWLMRITIPSSARLKIDIDPYSFV